MVDTVYPDILPKPVRLHHIVEDFLTEFDGVTSHVLPLRRYANNGLISFTISQFIILLAQTIFNARFLILRRP